MLQILKNEKKQNLGFSQNVIEDQYKLFNVKKKALLAAFRIVLKCPEHYEQFVDLLSDIFQDKNHGILISAVPLFEETFKIALKNQEQSRKLFPVIQVFIERVKSLMTHLDPEYTISGINDPFLVISMLRAITNSLTLAKLHNVDLGASCHENIEKLVIYSMSLYKPNKKTVNSVLYEIARLALFYKNSEQLTSCGFHILNQLMEAVDGSSNFRFVSLNLLKNFENFSSNSLNKLKVHCDLVLDILNNDSEDDSLQNLAL